VKYEKVKRPQHPRADIMGNVPVHIIVAEETYGPLAKGVLVHHKNFIKSDNTPSNLLPMTRKEHQQLPEIQARFLIVKGLYDEFLEFWEKEKEVVRIEHTLEQRQHQLNKLRKKHANLKTK
jgi:hypothetical protein